MDMPEGDQKAYFQSIEGLALQVPLGDDAATTTASPFSMACGSAGLHSKKPLRFNSGVHRSCCGPVASGNSTYEQFAIAPGPTTPVATPNDLGKRSIDDSQVEVRAGGCTCL